MNIVSITTTSFAQNSREPIDLLESEGYSITFNPYGNTLKDDEVVRLCKDSIGIIAGTETLDKDVINKLTKLKVISRCGAGLDNVDLDAAGRLGIKVFNTPDAPTMAVAELTVGLILDLLRKVSQMDREVRNGQWKKRMGNLLSEKRVGIIGFGRIGRKVADLLSPFNCKVAYNDINVIVNENEKKPGIEWLELDELLKSSDVVSLHVSSKKQIIGEREIGLMKKGVWLVNVSRGGVIDEDALFKALKDGHLAGAALDVFKEEPYTGPLQELDNVILTPHVGSYAIESRIKMEMEAAENLLKGLKASGQVG